MFQTNGHEHFSGLGILTGHLFLPLHCLWRLMCFTLWTYDSSSGVTFIFTIVSVNMSSISCVWITTCLLVLSGRWNCTSVCGSHRLATMWSCWSMPQRWTSFLWWTWAWRAQGLPWQARRTYTVASTGKSRHSPELLHGEVCLRLGWWVHWTFEAAFEN